MTRHQQMPAPFTSLLATSAPAGRALPLRTRMLSGSWLPHDKVPSESALMARYGVNRITVRQALGCRTDNFQSRLRIQRG